MSALAVKSSVVISPHRKSILHDSRSFLAAAAIDPQRIDARMKADVGPWKAAGVRSTHRRAHPRKAGNRRERIQPKLAAHLFHRLEIKNGMDTVAGIRWHGHTDVRISHSTGAGRTIAC
jgi:hypothetical protein